MVLREGEIHGEVTEASLERLLERKGMERTERGSMQGGRGGSIDKKQGAEDKRPNFMVTAHGARAMAQGAANIIPCFMIRIMPPSHPMVALLRHPSCCTPRNWLMELPTAFLDVTPSGVAANSNGVSPCTLMKKSEASQP